MADYTTEKFLNWLVGKTEVEDGLQRLDMLTKEESLMAAAHTLGVTRDTHRVVNVIKEDAHNISDNLESNKRGAPHRYLVISLYTY